EAKVWSSNLHRHATYKIPMVAIINEKTKRLTRNAKTGVSVRCLSGGEGLEFESPQARHL
ncbi:hypothetical protein, partial [Cloacibacillus sp.]|uniref:hypothetical protein n=1 Tax=Cloacibacillus sp. TaxID=2049023 RepID=UPI0025C2AC47